MDQNTDILHKAGHLRLLAAALEQQAVQQRRFA